MTSSCARSLFQLVDIGPVITPLFDCHGYYIFIIIFNVTQSHKYRGREKKRELGRERAVVRKVLSERERVCVCVGERGGKRGRGDGVHICSVTLDS